MLVFHSGGGRCIISKSILYQLLIVTVFTSEPPVNEYGLSFNTNVYSPYVIVLCGAVGHILISYPSEVNE